MFKLPLSQIILIFTTGTILIVTVGASFILWLKEKNYYKEYSFVPRRVEKWEKWLNFFWAFSFALIIITCLSFVEVRRF